MPRNVLRKLRGNLREYGLRETLERSGLWVAERLWSSTLHRHRRAPLSAFAEATESMHFSAEELAQIYLFPRGGQISLSQVKSEYEVLFAEITGRYAERNLVYPQCYAVEQGAAFLLYALVRSLRPGIVLETGIANGHSSFFILNAMRANGHGLLHSIDCSPEVGSLLADQERDRWSLHVLDVDNLKRSFTQILEKLPSLDLFLHDSDHTNAWQTFELAAAMRKVSPGGVVLSDDCDGCYAFLDVCRNTGLRPVVLVERRKIFGLIFTELPKQRSMHVGADIGLTKATLASVQ
jgi:predicted O-methyltransferase YrrM